MQKGTDMKDTSGHLKKLQARERYDNIKPIIDKIQGNLSSITEMPHPENYSHLVQLCKYIDPEITLAIHPLTSDNMKRLTFDITRNNVYDVLNTDDTYNKKEEVTQAQFLEIYTEKGWQGKWEGVQTPSKKRIDEIKRFHNIAEQVSR